jgi:plasmid stabilization system protein ParE
VDDARIQALTAEVLADLRTPAAFGPNTGGPVALEARVAALEAAVRSLASAPLAGATGAPQAVTVVNVRPAATAIVPSTIHPSLRLLGPSGGGDACVLEPDKPCVGSGQCRTFGH